MHANQNRICLHECFFPFFKPTPIFISHPASSFLLSALEIEAKILSTEKRIFHHSTFTNVIWIFDCYNIDFGKLYSKHPSPLLRNLLKLYWAWYVMVMICILIMIFLNHLLPSWSRFGNLGLYSKMRNFIPIGLLREY